MFPNTQVHHVLETDLVHDKVARQESVRGQALLVRHSQKLTNGGIDVAGQVERGEAVPRVPAASEEPSAFAGKRGPADRYMPEPISRVLRFGQPVQYIDELRQIHDLDVDPFCNGIDHLEYASKLAGSEQFDWLVVIEHPVR